jgi:hypothetical protein
MARLVLNEDIPVISAFDYEKPQNPGRNSSGSLNETAQFGFYKRRTAKMNERLMPISSVYMMKCTRFRPSVLFYGR